MLKRARRFLTSRTTVLGLILLLTAAMTATVIVPQEDLLKSGGVLGMPPAPAPRWALVHALGLDHVFATWWFVSISVLFVVSLALSTLDQFKVVRSRLRQPPPGGQAGLIPCALPRAGVEAALRREGYRRVSQAPGRTRHVKFRLGYGGSFMLHAGMTVTILSALVYVLTEHRVSFKVVSGPGEALGPTNSAAQHGLLGGTLPLPAVVRLQYVEPTFHENDALRDLASQVVFTDEAGQTTLVRVAINDFQRYRGLLLYQLAKFGNAFNLVFTGPDGRALERTLELPFPSRRDLASYGTVPLDGGRLAVKAKYYARPDRAGMTGGEPRLVLRLLDGEAVLAEVTLAAGERAPLGPYQVRLASVDWWTVLLVEGSLGTTGIFTGFVLLLLGSSINFIASPREAVVHDTPDGCALAWRPVRFSVFYREEGERLLARCKGEVPT